MSEQALVSWECGPVHVGAVDGMLEDHVVDADVKLQRMHAPTRRRVRALIKYEAELLCAQMRIRRWTTPPWITLNGQSLPPVCCSIVADFTAVPCMAPSQRLTCPLRCYVFAPRQAPSKGQQIEMLLEMLQQECMLTQQVDEAIEATMAEHDAAVITLRRHA